MQKCVVESCILNPEFSYLQPYFYNNPYALRCELGIGDSDEEYMANAGKRALEIYHLLFPRGADAIFFNYYIWDYSGSGEAEELWDEEDQNLAYYEALVKTEAENLRFLLHCQHQYRHVTLSRMEDYEEDDHCQRNRVVCYSDGKGFDYETLIRNELSGTNGHNVSFVSFEEECIFSVYDDRGCDVVFMSHEKMRKFYEKLKPYFLADDLEEMERRHSSAIPHPKTGRYPCPCCGCYTIETPKMDEICPVCFWEDDAFMVCGTERSECNHMTLEQGRRNYQKFGACDEDMVKHVRLPEPEERSMET